MYSHSSSTLRHSDVAQRCRRSWTPHREHAVDPQTDLALALVAYAEPVERSLTAGALADPCTSRCVSGNVEVTSSVLSFCSPGVPQGFPRTKASATGPGGNLMRPRN